MSDIPPKQPVSGTASARVDSAYGFPPLSQAEPSPDLDATGALVSLHHAASQAGTDSFPVLKAFQEYLESERRRARRRVALVSALFAGILVFVIAVFLVAGLLMFRYMKENQDNLWRKLDAQAAPTTVNNFVVLARSHFYDGIPFHRVVPDFVIQAGDPTDTDDLTQLGAGGPGYTIPEEPPTDGVYDTYDLAMAKTQEPNSTGSQFFVVTGDPAPLNSSPTYSLFGTVTDGKNVVDAIGNAPVGGPNGDTPEKPVTIESVQITEK